MYEPGPLLATGDNYVVKKVSRLGNANHLLGLYQKHNSRKNRHSNWPIQFGKKTEWNKSIRKKQKFL